MLQFSWVLCASAPYHFEIELLYWSSRRIVLEADLEERTPVEVKQVYFPGWEATL